MDLRLRLHLHTRLRPGFRRVASAGGRLGVGLVLLAAVLLAPGVRVNVASAASASRQDAPPSIDELRVRAGVLLDRLEAIEATLGAEAADVALAQRLSAELDGLLETLNEAVRARADVATRRTLRQLPLVRSAVLPRFGRPSVVVVAADPEGLEPLDPDDPRSWTEVRDQRIKAVRERRAEAAAEGRLSDLSSALVSAVPGTVIVLEPGRHTFTGLRALAGQPKRDVAIVGPGPDRCTIHVDRDGGLAAIDRVLIAGVSIDLNSTPLCDLRGGSLALRDVAMSGYNSGSGGSNGLFALGPATLVLESVRMDGGPGRSAGRTGGDAMDVRGEVAVHARQVRFRNHDELGRFHGTTVFDRCIAINRPGQRFGMASEYRPNVMAIRASNLPVRPFAGGTIDTLAASVDDAVVVRLAAGGEADDETLVAGRDDDANPTVVAARALTEQLSLPRRPLYWIALLADPRADVRDLAADRLRSLLGPAGLREALLSPPEIAGAAEVEARVPGLLVHAAVRNWWEANRTDIHWNAASGTFVRRAD